jgi:hypothetical protein
MSIVNEWRGGPAGKGAAFHARRFIVCHQAFDKGVLLAQAILSLQPHRLLERPFQIIRADKDVFGKPAKS